jgi:ABC-type lipoprotein release transport system permease subunit
MRVIVTSDLIYAVRGFCKKPLFAIAAALTLAGVMIGAVGLTLGIAAALALTRFLSGLLFGMDARDPITFVALPLGLLLVAVLATLIPAARVVRVNPVVALRGE